MAALGQRTRWTPPPTAQVDWSHPLAAGLVLYCLPIYGRDLVTGLTLTRAGTAYGFVATPLGPGFSSSASGASLQLPTPQNPTTIFAGGSTLTAAGVYTGGTNAELVKYQGTGLPLVAIGLTGSGGSKSITFDNRASTYNQITALYDTSLGFVMSGTLTTAGAKGLWLNGARVNSTTADAPATASNVVPSVLGGFAGISVAMAHARALSASEVASLHADPFQMLRW